MKKNNSIFKGTENPKCYFCVYATHLPDDQVDCSKKGVVSENYICRKYKYDIFKKTVRRKKTPDFSKFNKEDFKL